MEVSQTGDLVDLMTSLTAFVQQMGWVLVIAGGAGGIYMAGHSGYGLWNYVNDESREGFAGAGNSGPGPIGLVMGICAGAAMTMISVIVGAISWIYT